MAAREKDDGYIRWRCKACGQRLKVKKTYEGGDVMPCPRCGEIVNVPMGNIEAIAKGTEMAETGDPGRLNVDRELLMKRLRGDEKATGPGSVGRSHWTSDRARGGGWPCCVSRSSRCGSRLDPDPARCVPGSLCGSMCSCSAQTGAPYPANFRWS